MLNHKRKNKEIKKINYLKEIYSPYWWKKKGKKKERKERATIEDYREKSELGPPIKEKD